MLRSAIRAALLTTAMLGVCAAPLVAQLNTDKAIAVKTTKPKLVNFRGEVVNANVAQITVRSRENERVVRTFTYSDKAREKMQQILDRGGYQYGDKVVIQHEAGSDVALQIKGKPSKPR